MTTLLAGVLLGCVGSGHCAAMCGPLVLAIGPRLDRPSQASRFARLLLYHGGRLFTYLMLALPAGLAGQVLSLSGFERAAAFAGALVLLGVAVGVGRARLWSRFVRVPSRAVARGCVAAARWSRGRPLTGTFAAGALNGLMPCGLVYAAAAAAAGTGTPDHAVLMMLGFGLGTVPALLSVSIAAVALPGPLRARTARFTPIVLVLAAALLLARAFDLPHLTDHLPRASHHSNPSQP